MNKSIDELLQDLEDEKYTLDEKQAIGKILSDLIHEGNSLTYDSLIKQDFRREPVSPKEFFSSSYYYGPSYNLIYPAWKRELEFVCDPINEVTEWIITGPIGGGKTTTAARALFYKLYYISCLNNPQDYYGLEPGHFIMFALYNIFKYKVQSTSYHVLRQFVTSSPYFQENFRLDGRKKLNMLFPNNIACMLGSTSIHMMGENVFALILDEANFMKGGSDPEASQAYDVYSSALTRVESRFIGPRQIRPWLLIIVSSKKHQSDFTNQRIDYLRKKGYGGRVSDFPIWELKAEGTFTKGSFKVLVGDTIRPSKILEKSDLVPEGMEAIDVPMEYYEAFQINCERALQDIGGIATKATRPFITRPESIYECIDKTRKHPFWVTSIKSDFLEHDPLEDYVDVNKLTKIQGSRRVPLVNPHIPREIHIDIGLTGDALGFCIGHPFGVKKVPRVSLDGVLYNAAETIVYIDFMLQIQPQGEIDLQAIRLFITFIHEILGYPISQISYDGFQSRESIQLLRKAGYDAEVLSVDRGIEPYSILQRTILESRLHFYEYAPVIKELANLIDDKERGKVDHPKHNPDGTKGSKDVSDALAAVVYRSIRNDVQSQDVISQMPELKQATKKDFHDLGWVYGDASKRVKNSLDKILRG